MTTAAPRRLRVAERLNERQRTNGTNVLAIRLEGYGGPECFQLREVDRPAIGAGDVLIRVGAAGVNPVDWKIRAGHLRKFRPFDLPTTIGNEIAGVIDAVGNEVTGFQPGDAVYANSGLVGGFAEYAALPARHVARKPDGLSMAEAAGLPVAVATATAALDYGEIGSGATILVHAAAGGVGHVLVQLAKARGAHVTAVASSANLDFVRSLGADAAVDRNTDYEHELQPFDAVVDCFGWPAQDRTWHLVRPGGYMVSVATFPQVEKAAQLGVKTSLVSYEPDGRLLASIAPLVDGRRLRVQLAAAYDVHDFRSAFDQVESGTTQGKVVITF